MAKVLLDNATISSVFRALGYIRVKNTAVINLDQTALEWFVEAILLADSVVIPNTYKQEYRATRLRTLSAECFEHVEVPPSLDADLRTISGSLSAVWFDAFEEGSSRGAFSRYFEQADAFARFLWERSSSEFYLVFRAIGVDKHNPLIDAFLASPAPEIAGRQVSIVGRSGERVDYEALSPHVKRMANVLTWLGNEYIWHQALAAQHDLEYLPHPLREFFAFDFMYRLQNGSRSPVAFHEVFRRGMSQYTKRLTDLLEEFGLRQHGYEVPYMLPLVLSEATSGRDVINVTAQLRDDPNVRELRECLAKCEAGRRRGNVSEYQRLLADFKKIGTNVLRQRGIAPGHIKFGPPSSIVEVSVSGDDLSVDVPIPRVLYKQFFVHRRYRAFLRSVMDEIAMVSTLGNFKDRLDRFIDLDPEAPNYSAFYAKQLQLGPFTRYLGTGERPTGPTY
jgi:hypothetical protein